MVRWGAGRSFLETTKEKSRDNVQARTFMQPNFGKPVSFDPMQQVAKDWLSETTNIHRRRLLPRRDY